ncbi:MAG: peptidyl-prolyl cis-trans isomerase [Gammaproteobacteria bacterium]|nr:peptidyl-prolyl cis-trans isomerase [Gammaproteobacteria bacterium]
MAQSQAPSTNDTSAPSGNAPSAEADSTPRVRISTSLGDIVLELDRARAPVTVENFLAYASAGYYDGTIFHRVIGNFMIQGGGFEPGLKPKDPTRPPIRNEADNGLKNERGSIAMARTSAPHSASAQFFINVVDNEALDHRDKSMRGWGYAVFGKVVEGMETVDKIRAVRTETRPPYRDVPAEPVIIQSVRQL